VNDHVLDPSAQLIGGAWVAAADGATRGVVDPSDGTVITEVPEGAAADAHQAVAAARRAFDTGPWPRTPGAERGEVLARVAGLVRAHREELARLETLDTGKTVVESREDMDVIAGVLDHFAALAARDDDRVIDAPVDGVDSHVTHEPVGVCALIAPWNYPLLQMSWKVAPALAAGNTLVAKPSEITPLTTIRFFGLLEQAGIPAGAANLVLGPGATVGEALVSSPDVDLVSFTGGIDTGRHVMRTAAEHVTTIALELGGKNPNIVFADADLDAAVDNALTAVFLHAGQVCSAGARLLVEDEIHDEVVDELARRIPHIRLGHGFADDTEMGPLISAEHRAKVEAYLEIARDEGATVLVGGGRPDAPALADGFYLEPTLVVGCTNDMRVVQEEVFGPVLTVESFSSEDEAVERANSTVYGLAGAVWTSDRERAHRVAARLRLGTVWINDYHPYFAQAEWGGMKRSGIGRELGEAGYDEFREPKHVYENPEPAATGWFARSA
jgi:betaine-aldehyde dehydrogenase